MPDDEYVVRPAGELDIANVPELRDEWIRVVEQVQPALFVIDLDAVTYLDSSALGAIVVTRNRQLELGGNLIVRHAGPRVARIFEMTGLSALLDVGHKTEPIDGGGPPGNWCDGG